MAAMKVGLCMSSILNYEQLCKMEIGDTIYEEFKEPHKVIPLMFNGIDFTTNGLPWQKAEHYLLLMECDEDSCMDYNWHYRVWNEYPTEEEMKTPWKEDPYKEYE